MSSQTDLVFDPPGPGTWNLDTQHYPVPMSLFKREYEPQTRSLTIGLGLAEYGVPMATIAKSIHGFMYNQGAPVGVPIGSGEQQDITNPVIAERVTKGQRAYNEKIWLKALELWDHDVKPDSIRCNRGLASVDVDALGHDDMISHMSHCRDNSIEMIRRHHRFSVPSVVAGGLLFFHTVEWTGLDVTELVSLLNGASPISSGITPDLIGLIEAMRADADAVKIVESGHSSSDKIERLGSIDGAVGRAMSDYLLVDGHRLATGFDIFNQCLFELPETVEDRIRAATEDGLSGEESAPVELVEKVRDQVPGQHRESFDELLSDARRMARLKDERGMYNDLWADGITRKAILAAGRMLLRDGSLSDPQLLLEASWPEMQLLMRGVEVVSNDELEGRRAVRVSLSWRDAPATLGPAPTPPQPLEGLPAEVARLNRAIGMSFGLMGNAKVAIKVDLTGASASVGVHEGRARVAVGGYDFTKVERGDVLVTSTHSEAFNVVAGRVGAIVTDTGGVLSHLAIVAREYKIPCVVACNNATAVIPDGALIRVDGKAGVVKVIS